jgi:hypothetical protein
MHMYFDNLKKPNPFELMGVAAVAAAYIWLAAVFLSRMM